MAIFKENEYYNYCSCNAINYRPVNIYGNIDYVSKANADSLIKLLLHIYENYYKCYNLCMI